MRSQVGRMSSVTAKRLQMMARTGSACRTTTEVNIALVGSIGSGKSALTVKYITKRFINEYDPDLEDTYSKQELMDNQDILMRIMDTCDKEGKDPDRYLKWADGYLVVYSITNRATFDTAHKYLEGISQHLRLSTTYDAPMILVGNKMDLERYRQISKAEGNALASQYDSAFFETTAAEEYESVERIFHEAIREILREQERFMPMKPLYTTEDKTQGTLLPPPGFERHKRPRSPGVGQKTTSLRKDSSEQNSRFSFLRGKGLKGIFQCT